MDNVAKRMFTRFFMWLVGSIDGMCFGIALASVYWDQNATSAPWFFLAFVMLIATFFIHHICEVD